MGIVEKPKAAFLEALGREFGFEPPAEHGLDSVSAIAAMEAGRARVFVGLGGNFVRATPDHEFTERALGRCSLTVQVSTTLNRSHLVTGQEALILPCLARSERDVQAGGPQFVTVEDSMSLVHRSEGRLPPAADVLRSEPAIVAGIAGALLGPDDPVSWDALVADYDRIRDHISRVVPGCEEMNRRVRQPGGFLLPNGARERRFETASGHADFLVIDLPESEGEAGDLRLTTIRSHDQYNTTVYSEDDRYRGVRGDRRVLLMHPDDLSERGLLPGDRVHVESRFGEESRRLRDFRALAYEIPRGCVAAYFPEANPLVPLSAHDDRSGTPSYKSIRVRVERAG